MSAPRRGTASDRTSALAGAAFASAILAGAFAAGGAAAAPLRILATGDMHGALSPRTVDGQRLGGAAEMLAYWRQHEGYEPRLFLVLACGDVATGSPLAAVSKGDAVIAAMNRMGYDAAVPGSHDFDFGADRLAAWRRAAIFPFLAANLVREGGRASDVAAAFSIYEEQGIKVGLIGLAPVDLGPNARRAGYSAGAYAPALRSAAALARGQGAQALIVISHGSTDELAALAPEAQRLGIPVLFGGHSHVLRQERERGVWLVSSGQRFEAYSRVDLEFDPAARKARVVSARLVWVQQANPPADPALAEDIARWQRRVDEEYGAVVGYTATGLEAGWALYNFIVDAWLDQTPGLDLALTNPHSFREAISPGPITKATILAAMPFENSLAKLTLSGRQLLAYLPQTPELMGLAGLRREGNRWLVARTGRPVERGASYVVLVNSYMYETSAALRLADPAPETVAVDWRRPVFDWLAARGVSRERPLETFVDSRPRVVP